ncbi:RNase adapter RapZ [Streptosporangium sp. NPDC048047]|uniref:RapZ C-terminal domain-containing protein n=1 Tax=Streptosporangium sp. NPDC048047 TaxID=3155748 RepID=UPI00342A654A
MTLQLISFGFLHDVPPTAHRVEDLRDRYRDPAAARPILDLDGRDGRVQAVVLATPGVAELVDNLTAYALLPIGPATIALGCAGGRHRAPAVAEILAARLRDLGRLVDVDHRHVHLPRVLTT